VDHSGRKRGHLSRAGAALAFTTGGALLCSAGEQATCWNFDVGDQIGIELVELYTPASSYTYQSVTVPAADPPIPVDSYPSCGPEFDFAIGETVHVTVSDVAGTDEGTAQCRGSSFVIDSPERATLRSTSTGGRGLLYVAGVSGESDRIVVDGCPSVRAMALLNQPGHSQIEDPVAGKVPAVVLVRSAELPLAEDGSCQTKWPIPSCADQFVVRIKRE
jgi:hypothetical protein